MTSVERVLEYCAIESEAAVEVKPLPSPSWPEHGAISARDVYFRYTEDGPDVLKGISFTIKPREKVKFTLSCAMYEVISAVMRASISPKVKARYKFSIL